MRAQSRKHKCDLHEKLLFLENVRHINNWLNLYVLTKYHINIQLFFHIVSFLTVLSCQLSFIYPGTPQIYLPPVAKSVILNVLLALYCNVISTPSPVVTWTKDGLLINASNRVIFRYYHFNIISQIRWSSNKHFHNFKMKFKVKNLNFSVIRSSEKRSWKTILPPYCFFLINLKIN